MSDARPWRVTRGTRASRIAAPLAAVLLLALAAAPWWADAKTMRTVVEFAYYLTLAEMWNLLAGYAGLVSVGQQAFVGLGGYLLFALTIGGGIDPILAIVLAGLIAAVFAVPTGLVVFRLDGDGLVSSLMITDVYFVPETKRASELLNQMQRENRRIAIVIEMTVKSLSLALTFPQLAPQMRFP